MITFDKKGIINMEYIYIYKGFIRELEGNWINLKSVESLCITSKNEVVANTELGQIVISNHPSNEEAHTMLDDAFMESVDNV